MSHGHGFARDLAAIGPTLLGPLARASRLFVASEGWFAHGYRNIDDFAREVLGRSGRWLRDLARLDAALDVFPPLRAALNGDDGGGPLGQKAALCIASVATPGDVDEWIAKARKWSLSALRKAVAEAKNGPADQNEGCSVSRAEEPSRKSPHRRIMVRLSAPPEVRLAFDAVRELHTAVVGRDGSIGDVIEAILGEAASACWTPLDEFQVRLRERYAAGRPSCQTIPQASVARQLRNVHSQSGCTPRLLLSSAMHRAQETLDEFHRLKQRLEQLEARLSFEARGPHATRSATSRNRDIRRLVRVLRRLIRMQDRLEIVMGDVLLEMHELRAWKNLGYAGLEEYAEVCLGWGRSTARRRVSLARQLRKHARVRHAYAEASLGEEAARWVVRRLERTSGAEGDWIDHARETSVKRLRDEEALYRRQDLLASIARGQTARRVPADTRLHDDATWHASLQRVPGRTREGILELEHGLLERLVRGGPRMENPLLLSLEADLAAAFLACVEKVRRELSGESPMTPAEESRARPPVRMARHFTERGEPVPAWAGLLAMLEECSWVWDEPRAMPRRPFDPVYQRDGYRCMAPGCTSRAKLEAHHVKYRSHGGTDTPDNLLALCLFHHQQGEHGMLARARGRAPLEVTWRLGEPSLQSWWRNERRLLGSVV